MRVTPAGVTLEVVGGPTHMLSFKIMSIIHKQEDGFKRAIISGRKSNKKFLQKLLIITLIYPREKIV